jgi:hypothetical protein
MNSSERAIVALIFLVPVLIAIWWIPQKWQVCGKLYDNLPAQIACMN